jgi:hypothetical protein
MLRAKEAAKAIFVDEVPPIFSYTAGPPIGDSLKSVIDTPKVHTALSEVPETKELIMPDVSIDDIVDPDIGHRGRKRYKIMALIFVPSDLQVSYREREIMRENLMRLMACTGRSCKAL